MKDKVIIKQFKNKAKKPVAGLTPEHAIYDKNGVRLDAKLGNVNLQEMRDLQHQSIQAIREEYHINSQALKNQTEQSKQEVREEEGALRLAVFNNKNTTGVKTFEKLIVHCWVKNWTGGTKKLLCKFAFRADPTYKSGIMLHICNEDYSDEQQCTYWSSLEEHDGNKILPWAPIQVGDEIYGQVQVEVNWETLPLAFNRIFDPVYLDKESVEIPQSINSESFATETFSTEDTDSGLVKAKNIYSDTTLFRVGPDTLADYSNYIKEIYISNIPTSGKHADDIVSLQHYDTFLYLGCSNFSCQLHKPCLNNIPYPIIYYNSSNPEYPDGTIGGYVVFKNAEGFFNTPNIENKNVNINAAYARDINNSPIISSYLSKMSSFKTDLFYRNNVYALEDNDVIRGIKLPDLLLTPELLSKFICYLKFTDIQVLPTDNIKLEVNFQKNGQVDYANRLAVYKNTDLIWFKDYGTNLPVGYSQIKHSVDAGHIALKVNWDAFKDIEDTTTYRSFSIRFNHDYLFDHNVNTEELDNALVLATEAIQKVDAINFTETKTVWELANDYNFWTNNYGYKALGQYTKPMTVNTTFNAIRLNKVKCYEESIIDYKIYKVKELASSVRQCPIGSISANTHTLLKEGELTLSTTYKDYIIKLNKSVIGNVGEQIVIYLVGRNEQNIIMAGDSNQTSGNPEKTSNVALLSTASDPWTGNWAAGSVVEDTNKGYFNIALTLLLTPTFITPDSLDSTLQEKVPELVDEAIKPILKIAIPDIVPAVVGTELNIWNDTITWSMDKGLSSPLNYMVLWNCSKGIITERCFRFTPEDNDAGKTYSCSCTIFDSRGTKIDMKQFSIKVFAKNAIASPKRCVYFGDSLGSSSATQVITNFRNTSKFTGTVPTFLGTRGSSTYPCEAVGGYGWNDYATKGRKAYRIMVTALGGTVAVGAKYLFNTTNVLIREVNIIDGTGNLLIEADYGVAIPEFTESGTLTKVSGGGIDTINYTGGFEESGNPLWNNETNTLDIALYRTRLGLSADEKLDAVSFQFGINDHGLANDTYKLKTYIDALYNAFITDNPNCKFIVGLTTTSGNTVNGSGANYGATQDWLTYTQDVQKIRLYLLKLKASGYSNMFIASPQLQLDRYYGYAFSERPISQRVSTTEQYHNNHVHPGSSGYGQIGDAFFAAFTSVLSE